MTLNLIGLGINDKQDITLKGLDCIKRSDKVYIEYYTCLLHSSIEELEELYGKKVEVLYRSDVEVTIEETLINEAKEKEVSLLIIGDALSATTHTDIIMRAKEEGVKINVVHNASVFTAIAKTGLQLYKFGKVTSIPFPAEYKITTPVTIYNQNQTIGAHTLFLLDLNPKEEKYLSANQAMKLLIEACNEEHDFKITSNTKAIVCARLGSESEQIVYDTIENLIKMDFGEPVHCLIIPGKMHFAEEEYLETL